ncbi:T9SS type A sorting domain-containing protein [Candidatus Amoebophilus asiaticus]|nr:T9SS type A sorting domain-containing protein [Candidatus Amoebophilus asiaticus]
MMCSSNLKAQTPYLDDCYDVLSDSALSSWEARGPFVHDTVNYNWTYCGHCYMETVDYCRAHPKVLYAGTNTAGVWKSVDDGKHWVPISERMLFDRVNQVAVHASDPDNVFITANSGFNSSSYPDFYRTGDGGENWEYLTSRIDEPRKIYDIKLGPIENGSNKNDNLVLVVTDTYLWISKDNGDTFQPLIKGDTGDTLNKVLAVEFHPTNANIIYLVNREEEEKVYCDFYASFDKGNSFTKINGTNWSGITKTESGDSAKIRYASLATTEGDPSKIYCCLRSTGGDYANCYIWHGSINTTTKTATWSATPGRSGDPGNGKIVAAHDSSNILVITREQYKFGRGSHAFSKDAGQTWASFRLSSDQTGYHADVRDVIFRKIDSSKYDLLVCTDGGLNRCSNYQKLGKSPISGMIFDESDWLSADLGYTQIGAGIQGAQISGNHMGVAHWDDVIAISTMHNGALIKKSGVKNKDGWYPFKGGDLSNAYVNYATDILTHPYGPIVYVPGRCILPEIGKAWFGGYKKDVFRKVKLSFDPTQYSILYILDGITLRKSEDFGKDFSPVYSFYDEILDMKVYWRDTEIMYLSTSGGDLWKSENGGDNWLVIATAAAGQFEGNIKQIEIHESNSQEFWLLTKSSDNMVLHTTDGGLTYENLLHGFEFDGSEINCIAYQRGTNGGIYMGTRHSVFFRDNDMTEWVMYNKELPFQTNTKSLVPKYKEGAIYLGSRRGVYSNEFFGHSKPKAQASVDKKEGVPSEWFQFYDYSALYYDVTTKWEWTFPGGNPNSSTDRNPSVQYSCSGTYDVTLKVTDKYRTDTHTFVDFITITPDYCASSGVLSEDFWIEKLAIGSINDTSGNDRGYGNFTDDGPYSLPVDTPFSIKLTPGHSAATSNSPGTSGTGVYWGVWIDLNKDSCFADSSELLYRSDTAQIGMTTSNITIPGTATSSSTRMRVAMSPDPLLSACGELMFGEVEDYTVYFEPDYCDLAATDGDIFWIDKMEFGTISNSSGESSGYKDFYPSLSTEINTNDTTPIKLTPGFNSLFSKDVFWNVWIDLNRDGDFADSGELMFQDVTGQTSMVTGSIIIPSTATPGPTRMRIATYYVPDLSSCGSFDAGEVEDYKVNIIKSSSKTGSDSNMNEETKGDSLVAIQFGPIYPNPTSESTIYLDVLGNTYDETTIDIQVVNLMGQAILVNHNLLIQNGRVEITLPNIKHGTYLVVIKEGKTGEVLRIEKVSVMKNGYMIDSEESSDDE